MENHQIEPKKTWQAPELEVVDAAEQTLNGPTGPNIDASLSNS
jgi:hypothetical protein